MDAVRNPGLDWSVSPEPVLRRLLPALPRGQVLYAGLDGQEFPEWLVAEGFEAGDGAAVPQLLGAAYTAARRMPDATSTGPRRSPGVASAPQPPDGCGGLGEPADGDRPGLVGPRFTLVVLDGVLSFLTSSEGDALIARARRVTRPGGVVYAAAYNVDEPARGGRAAVGNRLPAGQADPRRFLMPGELAMAFEGWMLLHATDGPQVEAGGRARWVSVVAARRPSGGALLV